MVSVKLYFNSCGVTSADDKINYTLGLLEGAADDWKSDFINTHTNGNGTWDAFESALEQAFAPAQQDYEAAERLKRHSQQGRYIEEYISGFRVLASQAGLSDSTATRQFFASGLDTRVRHEAL